MSAERRTPENRPGDDPRIARTSYVNDHYPVFVRNNRLRASDRRRLGNEASKFSHRPLVSLVLAVLEPERLERTLDSVLGQIYPGWELLCVRAPSPGGGRAWETLVRYERLDERVRAVRIERANGPSELSNAALSLASGEFVASLDSGDELAPDSLLEVVRLVQEHDRADLIYSDEDKIDERGERHSPHFKPGWSPDLLLCNNYVSRLCAYRRSLLDEIGGFREGFEGAQDYDLVLRFTERTDQIHHVPKVLYHRRTTANPLPARHEDNDLRETQRRALIEALRRRNLEGSVQDGLSSGSFRVKPGVTGEPLVTVLIPTRDNVRLLERCIEGIERRTTYTNYEILILDNGSVDPKTVQYLSGTPHRVIPFAEEFNYSRINNFGAAQAGGEYLLFLNDDTEVIRDEWMEEMLRHAQRPEVGAVGARLLYPTGRVQHAGVITGAGHAWGPGVAIHSHQHYPADHPGYAGAVNTIRNYSAVTAACMMLRKSVFAEAGGFDEKNLKVAFNDVDLCLRIRDHGYLIVYTPYAKLYHHESASRDSYKSDPAEALYMRERWGETLDRDPYYNSNFSLGQGDFNLRADLLRPRSLRETDRRDGRSRDPLTWTMSREDLQGYLKNRRRVARISNRNTLIPTEGTNPTTWTSRAILEAGVGTREAATRGRIPRAEQLIWMFGSPRTGSTWLSRIMADVDDQDRWHEPYVGLLFGSFLYERLEGNTRLLENPSFIMGEPHRKLWTRSIRNFVLEGAAIRFPNLGDTQHLVIKEPNGSIGAPLLSEAMPESRMVFLIRDGRDVVASRLDAFREGGWSGQGRGYDSSETLRDFTAHLATDYLKTVSQVQKAFESHPGKKALVRYEDLRADTMETLGAMYDSLKIEVDKAQLATAIGRHSWERLPEEAKGPGKFYRKASPGGWREDLTSEQVKLVEEITGPILSQFYPGVRSSNLDGL